MIYVLTTAACQDYCTQVLACSSLQEKSFKQLEPAADSLALARQALELMAAGNYQDALIVIDEDGILPFMICSKFRHVICALVSDIHSAYMTRQHNNANMLIIPAGMTGTELAGALAGRFAASSYAGGRHKIRLDMLERLGEDYEDCHWL